ncbi:DUF1559 family PulG-like putative transporter [Alienimonas californiensis]|uniref:DUF1559 domain-containing protein n=1 Tax=Alienimonas californiensis TaxID=2527989 RepID=A0A517PCV0_9PLAN|nr:DUF1559 domain-containing protein [Alienimonas californiensis]QDT17202.1 hypothetical protein CA12_33140 [Alienimonas californiensis]
MCHVRRRFGFSIVELLVVIGIVSLLCALIMPAVQQARQKAWDVECRNNLKQVGLAFHQHHGVFGSLPSNGGYDPAQVVLDADGEPFTPTTLNTENGKLYQWGVGDPDSGPREQTGSWAYPLLPFLDQQNAHAKPAYDAVVPTYACRARRDAAATAPPPSDAFGEYEGGGHRWGRTDYTGNGFLIFNRPKLMRFANVRDGTSNTLLVGEKAFDPCVQSDGSFFWDEPFFLGGSAGSRRYGLRLLPDGPGLVFKQNWGSPHAGGVNFLLCDGSVQQVPFTIDWQEFDRLLTPAKGLAIEYGTPDGPNEPEDQ